MGACDYKTSCQYLHCNRISYSSSYMYLPGAGTIGRNLNGKIIYKRVGLALVDSICVVLPVYADHRVKITKFQLQEHFRALQVWISWIEVHSLWFDVLLSCWCPLGKCGILEPSSVRILLTCSEVVTSYLLPSINIAACSLAGLRKPYSWNRNGSIKQLLNTL